MSADKPVPPGKVYLATIGTGFSALNEIYRQFIGQWESELRGVPTLQVDGAAGAGAFQFCGDSYRFSAEHFDVQDKKGEPICRCRLRVEPTGEPGSDSFTLGGEIWFDTEGKVFRAGADNYGQQVQGPTSFALPQDTGAVFYGMITGKW